MATRRNPTRSPEARAGLEHDGEHSLAARRQISSRGKSELLGASSSGTILSIGVPPFAGVIAPALRSRIDRKVRHAHHQVPHLQLPFHTSVRGGAAAPGYTAHFAGPWPLTNLTVVHAVQPECTWPAEEGSGHCPGWWGHRCSGWSAAAPRGCGRSGPSSSARSSGSTETVCSCGGSTSCRRASVPAG